MIGSRYYPTNQEIALDDGKIVRVFDENDLNLGDMTLLDAREAADAAQKDVVLRNAKIDPPVVKIMNYKKELLKRLFKKIGRDQDVGEKKVKMIRMATNISFHDFENKKKQC